MSDSIHVPLYSSWDVVNIFVIYEYCSILHVCIPNQWFKKCHTCVVMRYCYCIILGPLHIQQRPFLKKAGLIVGVPNLIVTTPGKCFIPQWMCDAFLSCFVHISVCLDNVLKTTLSLYLEDPYLPMPTPEEVLICNERTTAEEVCMCVQSF